MPRIYEKLCACLAGAAALCLGATPARAVIVNGANGTGAANVLPSNPPPVAGWANAGTILTGSGVYLGNGWGMTASHLAVAATINPGTQFTLTTGATFTVDQPSTRLKNADNSNADLLLFHLNATPSLPNLAISSSSPTVGTQVLSMGNGLTRSGGDASGFSTTLPHVYRWGNNLTNMPLGGATATTNFNTGGSITTIFGSTFDSAGQSSEMQLSDGDSGGPVFNSSNVLVGMNLYAFAPGSQPADRVNFGNESGYADLATYRGQIATITGVPEPASIGVMGMLAAGVLLRRRNSRAAFTR